MAELSSVLIVDDEAPVRNVMARWAASLGFEAWTAANAADALAILHTTACDMAVVDVMMPEHDGLWLAAELHRQHPSTAVVLATGYASLLPNGAPASPPIADLITKPIARERFVLALDRGRQWRKRAIDDLQWQERLETEMRGRIDEVCATIDREAAAGADERLRLAALLAGRAPEVLAHGERVARYALSMAREIGLDATARPVLADAARLHDVGKLAMPDALLTKPSPLTPEEQGVMRQHADAGAEILASTRTLQVLAPIVLASHEWFGGGGYPLRLAGDAIPLASRVIAVADSYDAMTQDRRYRHCLDATEAVAELLRCSGSQFDPDLVAAFLAVLARQ